MNPPPSAEGNPVDRLLEMLTRTKWNITQTAMQLGLSRKTVRVRIQRYKLRHPSIVDESSGAREIGQSAPEGVDVPVRGVPAAIGSEPSTSLTTAPLDDVAEQPRRAADMPEVRIRTLGRFVVACGERSLLEDDWEDQSARELLGRLVTHRHQSASLGKGFRPKLAVRAGSLAAVAALRRALAEVGSDTLSGFVVEEENGLGLSPETRLWVDADAFESLIAQARDVADPLPLLQEANALYVGDYLPDESGEDWSVAAGRVEAILDRATIFARPYHARREIWTRPSQRFAGFSPKTAPTSEQGRNWFAYYSGAASRRRLGGCTRG
jgi:hypothetical protein